MLFKCKYVNNVPTVVPLANMSDNITDNASQVTITDTHGISGSVGAVTDLQTLTNTGSQKAMNNLAELVNDATAPKNYAMGDHILRNGQYSKVKQAIQQGGNFTSSNLEAACIGDEISTISSDLASEDWVQIYPTFNSATVQSGTIKAYKNKHLCCIHLAGVIFKASGDNQTIVTGAPKALMQVGNLFSGIDSTNTAAISAQGECSWIAGGVTVIQAHLRGTYNYQHWITLVYPVNNS